MNPALNEFCFRLLQKLTAAAALMALLCGAPAHAQLIFDGPGAGYILPSGAHISGPETACSSNHYHGALPFPGGPTYSGQHCGWGRVGTFTGGSLINLNTPGGPFDATGLFAANNERFNVLLPGAKTGDTSSARSGFKISDTDTPKPQDRVFFQYDYYSSIGGPGGTGGLTRPAIPRFDRVFIGGTGSPEVRLPFIQSQGVQVMPNDLETVPNPGGTMLLFPFVTNQAGFDTGLAIQNPAIDPFATKPPASGFGGFKFTTFTLIEIPGGNPLALGLPIEAPPGQFVTPPVQPPAEDLDAKARREVRDQVKRMSPEDRQKALKDSFVAQEFKTQIIEQNAIDLVQRVSQSDAVRSVITPR